MIYFSTKLFLIIIQFNSFHFIYLQFKYPREATGRFTFTIKQHITGADPGILVRGGVDFFSKAWGSGPALRSPVGPGQRPGGFPGGEAPGTS